MAFLLNTVKNWVYGGSTDRENMRERERAWACFHDSAGTACVTARAVTINAHTQLNTQMNTPVQQNCRIVVLWDPDFLWTCTDYVFIIYTNLPHYKVQLTKHNCPASHKRNVCECVCFCVWVCVFVWFRRTGAEEKWQTFYEAICVNSDLITM